MATMLDPNDNPFIGICIGLEFLNGNVLRTRSVPPLEGVVCSDGLSKDHQWVSPREYRGLRPLPHGEINFGSLQKGALLCGLIDIRGGWV